MSFTNQIEHLWESQESMGIGQALSQIIILLNKAKEVDEEIPLKLALDVICQANYVLEYGNKPEEFAYIIYLWHRCLEYYESNGKSDLIEVSLLDKIYYLSSITIQVYLGNVMFDIQQKNTATITSFQETFHVKNEILSQVGFLYQKVLNLVVNPKISYWKYFCISDLISLFCILKLNSDKIEGFNPANLKHFFKSDDELIKGWIADWQENIVISSDKFRFIYLMIFESHPDSELWITIAKSVFD